MSLGEKPNPTGWESIDTLLLETYHVFNEYEAVRKEAEKIQSSEQPKSPSEIDKMLRW